MNHLDDLPRGQIENKGGSSIALALKIVSFLVIALLALMVAVLSPDLSRWQFLFGLALVLLGLPLLLLSHSSRPFLSAIKTAHIAAALALMVALWGTAVTTKIVDTIVIDRPSREVLDYAASVKRWPEWHPQSLHVYLDHTRALAKGEGFEEDIDTPIGQNHMVWKVEEYQLGSHWLASAENQNNGALVLLNYRVRSDESGQTVFERTLEYTLSAFHLVAANGFYMRQQFERKSEDALVRLKHALEAN